MSGQIPHRVWIPACEPAQRPWYARAMNYYHMWVNLRDSRQDLQFAEAVRAYLDHF